MTGHAAGMKVLELIAPSQFTVSEKPKPVAFKAPVPEPKKIELTHKYKDD